MKPPPSTKLIVFLFLTLAVPVAIVQSLRLDSSPVSSNLAGHRNPLLAQFAPKLARIVDSFERSCRNQGQGHNFDRRAIETELRSCFSAPMDSLLEIVTARDSGASVQLVTIVEKIKPGTSSPGSLSLSRGEIELLRTHIVEPICFYSSKILDCFAPHYNRILEECTSDPEGKAMQYSDQIVIALCRGNGSRLIDFLETGGLECVDQYYNSALSCLNNQSMSFSDSMDLLKYSRTPDSVTELCGDLADMHTCLTSSVGTCRRTEPARLMRTALNEIHEWTVGACLGTTRGRGGDKEAAHAYSGAPGTQKHASYNLLCNGGIYFVVYIISHLGMIMMM